MVVIKFNLYSYVVFGGEDLARINEDIIIDGFF